MTGQPIPFDPSSLLREEAFVRRLARGLLFDDHEVDDVVQETWMAAMRNRPASTERRSTRAFLSTVVRRKAADQARTSSRRRRRETSAAERSGTAVVEATDEALAREELRTRVVEALRQLESPYREAVTLRYLEDLEPASIAEQQGVNANTVRSQIHRGLKKIREQLDRSEGNRQTWCLGLVPLALPRASSAVIATTATTAGLSIWAKLIAVLLLATGAVLVWLPDDDQPEDSVPRFANAVGLGDESTNSARGSNDDSEGDGGSNAAVRVNSGSPSTSSQPSVGAIDSRLTGRLLDPDGRPMPGATVQFIALDGPRMFVDAKGLSGATAITDEEGRFESPPLPATSDCSLLADKGGDLQQLVLIPQTVAYGTETNLGDLRLEPRGTVDGQVLDGNGQPVAGAEVFATDLPPLALSAVPIQRFHPLNGALFFAPRLGDKTPYQLSRAVRTMLIRIGRNTIRDFESDKHQPLILNGDGVLPIWDVLPIPRTWTDDEGRFRLGSLPSSPQTIVVAAQGHQSLTRGPVTVAERESKSLGTMTLRDASELEGLVLDENDAPCQDAEVRVAPLGLVGFRGVTPVSAPVRTDEHGHFLMDSLDRGRVLVLFRRGAGHQWSVHGPESADSMVELRLEPTLEHELEFEGIEADEIAEVIARPTPPLGELSAIGAAGADRPLPFEILGSDRLLLSGLEEGTWTLQLELRGERRITQVIDVPTQSRTRIEVPKLHRAEITVVDSDGRGIAGAEVLVRTDTNPEQARILASHYGLALWDDYLPEQIGVTDVNGRLTVDVLHEGDEIHASSRDHGIGSVLFDPESPTRIELFGQGHLRGRVVLRSGDSVPSNGLRVSIRPVAIGHEAQALAEASSQETPQPVFVAEAVEFDRATIPMTSRVLQVGEDGVFETHGLPLGRYELELIPGLPQSLTILGLFEYAQRRASIFSSRTEPLATQQVEVRESGITEAELAFDDGATGLGSLRGRILANGQPMVGARIYVREESPAAWAPRFENDPRAITDSNGEFEMQTLEATETRFGICPAGHDDIVGQFQETILGGITTDAQWSVSLGSVTLRALGPDGSPLPNLPILLQAARPDGLEDREWHELIGEPGFEQFRRVSDQSGLVTFSGIRAGDYRAICQHLKASSEEAPVYVRPGALDSTIDLPIGLACGVVLKITDPSGILATAGHDPSRNLMSRVARVGVDRFSWIGHSLGSPITWWIDEPGRYEVFSRIGNQDLVLSTPEIELRTPTEFGEQRVIEAEVIGLRNR
ncbi:MAG: sigma-70 family RNA polymerase sigma factor [Planctomycetota bacterium]